MCVSTIKVNTFTGNIGDYGAAIYNNADIMLLVGNFMSNNEVNIVGNEIFNNNTLANVNLTFLANSTSYAEKIRM